MITLLEEVKGKNKNFATKGHTIHTTNITQSANIQQQKNTI